MSSFSDSSAADLEIKSILLLDDDADLANMLSELLESHNFLVTVVKNGAEGLRQVMETDFDVIMCDIMMPSMAGDMFYLAVQKLKPQLCGRFIFLTGFADDPNVAKFLSTVPCQVLGKPLETQDIIRAISLVIQQTAEAERASS